MSENTQEEVTVKRSLRESKQKRKPQIDASWWQAFVLIYFFLFAALHNDLSHVHHTTWHASNWYYTIWPRLQPRPFPSKGVLRIYTTSAIFHVNTPRMPTRSDCLKVFVIVSICQFITLRRQRTTNSSCREIEEAVRCHHEEACGSKLVFLPCTLMLKYYPRLWIRCKVLLF